ncbi:MAG: hypothetical protein EBR02_02210 [Alphaproteobacteria bacterium]|nr:hypothetical protein [Alphaproteobacteria bacterium]
MLPSRSSGKKTNPMLIRADMLMGGIFVAVIIGFIRNLKQKAGFIMMVMTCMGSGMGNGKRAKNHRKQHEAGDDSAEECRSVKVFYWHNRVY